MDLEEIKAVMMLMKENQITAFDYDDGDVHYRLKRKENVVKSTPVSAAPAEVATGDDVQDAQTINAQMVGIFYTTPSPDEEPFVKVGDDVTAGQTIGVIEAMKMVHDVKADRSGKIVKILAANEENVEFNQPLFEIE
ncbi:acetyl-CoA carboxylase biotin carboxyl carrier protein [Weissella bombi]|uniref:Biotin carboxyl carrier protein of acetyl-CoA carboxylase n=1 Tax=Weissella bombi TaxID=1505725 RepID=A0A1C4BII3_9LACO|nr:biotin/lipoyl-containing protein [Weissella bombi]SCC06699.1 acetyl-CoA carboxylase biotin carboxyl carrier protein [Weissella bombi]